MNLLNTTPKTIVKYNDILNITKYNNTLDDEEAYSIKEIEEYRKEYPKLIGTWWNYDY